MVLTNPELEALEKKYHDIIGSILSNNIGRFINEINSQKNIPTYTSSVKVNPIETGVENIMNAMIARRLDWGIASMQGASDSCYECGDSIVHIDAKTILDTDGDVSGETNRMDIRQNQTSFDFEHTYEVEHSKTHKKYKWKPKLHRYEKHKLFGNVPNLTYFLRIIWSETNLVEEISLICIPNGQFFDTHKTILAGVKSYPTKDENLEHLRFDIKKLTTLDSWRQKVIYKRLPS
jgi:hypothetical protein